MTMGRVGAGELEGWRLLNQQKPLGGWFSDASTTSVTESFPSYLFSLFKSLSLSLSLSPSLSLFSTHPSFHFLSVARSLTMLLLRYTLRFVLTGDYDTHKRKDSPLREKPLGVVKTRSTAVLLMNYFRFKMPSCPRLASLSPFIRQTPIIIL